MAKPSFILGLIGGILGLISGFLALAIGSLAEEGVLGVGDASIILGFGWATIIFSILGIIFSNVSIKKQKIAGWLMLISGIAVSICIYYSVILPVQNIMGWFGLLPAVLLVIGGIVALKSEGKKRKK